ncbi:unnamed protein product [Prorocentrum cordatum]|uniref:Uncharacterized protein n=1 Tax=Prorocentrum cordatum TaxID=2364126 RepID=A0ABN9QJT6_9DINO|nr:unnamed protein product [Polarella glacialis]
MGTSKVSEIIGQEVKDYQKAVVESHILERVNEDTAPSPATPSSISIASGSVASGSSAQTPQSTEKQKGKGRGRGKGKGSPAAKVHGVQEVGKTYAESVDYLMSYLRKINADDPHIETYKRLFTFAALRGQVILDGKAVGKEQVVKKFSMLRKIIKRQVYNTAKLAGPRISDVDFPHGLGPIDGGDASQCRSIANISEEVAENMMVEQLPFVKKILDYFKMNPISASIDCHMAPARISNEVMMEMWTYIDADTTPTKLLMEGIVPTTCSKVLQVLPCEFDEAIDQYEALLQKNESFKQRVSESGSQVEAFKEMLNMKINSTVVKHVRVQLLAKVVQHLGTMNFKRKVGDEVKMDPWVSSFVSSLMKVACGSHAVSSKLGEMADDVTKMTPVIEIYTKAAMPWDEFVKVWIDKINKMSQVIAEVDVDGFRKSHDATMDELKKMDMTQLSRAMWAQFESTFKYGMTKANAISAYQKQYNVTGLQNAKFQKELMVLEWLSGGTVGAGRVVIEGLRNEYVPQVQQAEFNLAGVEEKLLVGKVQTHLNGST